MKRKSLIAVALLAVIAAVICFVLLRPGAPGAGARIFLDGEPFSGPALSPSFHRKEAPSKASLFVTRPSPS